MSLTDLTNLHDAYGNSVTPDMRPPDVTDLPLYTPPIDGTPKDIDVHYLGGNWYGDGPCVVLWHTKRKVHAILPISKLSLFKVAIRHLRQSPSSPKASGYLRTAD